VLKIPWGEYSEEEIQGIVYQYFLSLDYRVDWFHLEDKNKEKQMGCDLLCSKDKETIAIAVKKRPKSEDITQLQRLARKNYTKRIYLSVEKPTPSFRDSAKKYGEKIVTWEIGDFERLLRTEDQGLQILACIYYSNSDFVKVSVNFLTNLHSVTKVIDRQEIARNVSKPMPCLWQLKDLAVTMRKPVEILLSILEDPTFVKGVKSDASFVIFLKTLESLEWSMKSFVDIWTRMLKNDDSILRQTLLKYGNRSNWGDLWHFEDRVKTDTMYAPGTLKNHLGGLGKIEKKEYEKDEQKLSVSFKRRGIQYEPVPYLVNYIRESFLRGHFGLGLALENTIDQMFEL